MPEVSRKGKNFSHRKKSLWLINQPVQKIAVTSSTAITTMLRRVNPSVAMNCYGGKINLRDVTQKAGRGEGEDPKGVFAHHAKDVANLAHELLYIG